MFPNILISNEIGLGAEYVLNRKELVIASGSEDYLDVSELNELEIELPGVVSNVENGTGVIAGIARRRVPLDSCFDENGNLVACEEL